MWTDKKRADEAGTKGIAWIKKVNSPGSFFVRNDAFVIIDFDTVTTVVDGVKATEIPIGPSLG